MSTTEGESFNLNPEQSPPSSEGAIPPKRQRRKIRVELVKEVEESPAGDAPAASAEPSAPFPSAPVNSEVKAFRHKNNSNGNSNGNGNGGER